MVGWPSGPRRQFQALVSSEAWVRIPLQSLLPVSLDGQDRWLSPTRPGFDSRTGNIIFFFRCRAGGLRRGALGARVERGAATGPTRPKFESDQEAKEKLKL